MGEFSNKYSKAVVLNGYAEKLQHGLYKINRNIAHFARFLACLQGIPKYKYSDKQG